MPPRGRLPLRASMDATFLASLWRRCEKAPPRARQRTFGAGHLGRVAEVAAQALKHEIRGAPNAWVPGVFRSSISLHCFSTYPAHAALGRRTFSLSSHARKGLSWREKRLTFFLGCAVFSPRKNRPRGTPGCLRRL